MKGSEFAVVVAWFVLASYVLARCLTSDVDLDLILAAWSGGVLSTVCYFIVQRRRGL